MPGAPVLIWLSAFIAVVAVQRFSELLISQRHGRRLREQGARLHPDDGFGAIVAVHVLLPLLLAGEVLLLGARPGAVWPVWLGLWLGAQGLRYASIRALGHRWHLRVLVPPEATPLRHGPYRFLQHPNYAAVVVELVAGTLMFGAWRTMIVISLLNGFALARRIRVENRAVRPPPARAGLR